MRPLSHLPTIHSSKKDREGLKKNLPFLGSAKKEHSCPPHPLSASHCKLIRTLPFAVKTFHARIPSNVLDVPTTRSLPGRQLLSESKEKSPLRPAAPSSALLAVIDFRLPPPLFDLDYVLSAGAQGRARQQLEI